MTADAQFLVIVPPAARVVGSRDVLRMFPFAKRWVADAMTGDVLNTDDGQITCLGRGVTSTLEKPRKGGRR